MKISTADISQGHKAKNDLNINRLPRPGENCKQGGDCKRALKIIKPYAVHYEIHGFYGNNFDNLKPLFSMIHPLKNSPKKTTMKTKRSLILFGLVFSVNLHHLYAAEGSLVSIGGGGFHSLYVTSAGTVKASGTNSSGQLGDGTTTNSTTHVATLNLTGITEVAAGTTNHSLALKSDGTVWSFGSNGSGQLGDGTGTSRSTPVQVTGLTGVVQIGAGSVYSAALKSNGTVWCWGSNSVGQLGIGSLSPATSNTAVQVTGLTGVKAISVGSSFCMALKDDGTVWSWGDNSTGQLGINNTTASSSPVQATGVTDVAKITAGYYHAMALKGNGTLLVWGRNQEGQLGLGTSGTNSLTAQTLSGFGPVVSMAGGSSHAMAILSDGSVWAWGDDTSGALGDSAAASSSTVPVFVAGFPATAACVNGGGAGSMAVESNGRLWSWGSNSAGRLGDGSTTTRFMPVYIGLR
jgi:alpha-tubulin suppressor-like RCC1 family protein